MIEVPEYVPEAGKPAAKSGPFAELALPGLPILTRVRQDTTHSDRARSGCGR
jgi:hypothetical protein